MNVESGYWVQLQGTVKTKIGGANGGGNGHPLARWLEFWRFKNGAWPLGGNW